MGELMNFFMVMLCQIVFSLSGIFAVGAFVAKMFDKVGSWWWVFCPMTITVVAIVAAYCFMLRGASQYRF